MNKHNGNFYYKPLITFSPDKFFNQKYYICKCIISLTKIC